MTALPFRADDLRICRDIQAAHATSYALATRLFPPEQRAATQVLYAFVRTADDLVDEPCDPHPDAIRRSFDTWRQRWDQAVQNGGSDDPVLRASATLFAHYNIPLAYANSFLDAMRRDIDCHRYDTYASLLQDYVYGSAAVVGLCLCRICGVHDDATLQRAQHLGEAMQLTNFLRDIDADFRERGRLYLATDDLRDCGATEADILAQHVSPSFVRLLQLYIDRARALYTSADIGIAALPNFARKPVRLSRILYTRILDQIERCDYDVFRHRARTKNIMKLLLCTRILLTP